MAKIKDRIEFDVDDAFDAMAKIKRLRGVFKDNVYMITCTRIAVWYDNRLIQPKIIVKKGKRNSHYKPISAKK